LGNTSFVRIAQITLASADPAAQAAFWSDTLGLPVEGSDGAAAVLLQRSTIRFEQAAGDPDPRYHFVWGGRDASRLAAIGDDHGVVIVAPAGRGWIPVGLPAEPLRTTIVAEGPRRTEITLQEGPYRLVAIG
jgi:catechol 2,3-dioxygenase-like lactoylglutathione lyase family enzyme